MARENGKITRIKDGWMTVQLQSGEKCSACASKSACFFAGPESHYRYIKIHAVPGYHEGNQVVMDYRESSKILAAVVVFFLPLLFLVGGYFIGDRFLSMNTGGIWGAIGGFLVSTGVIYLLNRWLSRSRFFLPQLAGRVNNRKNPTRGPAVHHF